MLKIQGQITQEGLNKQLNIVSKLDCQIINNSLEKRKCMVAETNIQMHASLKKSFNIG